MRAFCANSIAVAVFGVVLSAFAGDSAPNLDLQDLKGAHHKLTEYRGKIVVLNFWATYCVPCATEMPLLSEMQRRYKDKIVFVAASVDDEDQRKDVESFIHKHKGDALTVMMGATLDNLHDFGVPQALPATIFIDAEGNILGRVSGALKRTDLQARLRRMTSNQKPQSVKSKVKKQAKKQISEK